jgi:YD repeat-containing protein
VVFKYEYNTLGNVTKATDPIGRETVYEYDTNPLTTAFRTRVSKPRHACPATATSWVALARKEKG